MNKDRRKQIAEAIATLSGVIGYLEPLRDDIESLQGEEQEYLDNMPESLQNGDRGQQAQEAIENLERAVDALNEFLDADVVNLLEEAAQ